MSKNTYKLTVNDQKELDLSSDTLDLDFVENGGGQFHVLHQQQSYKAEVLEMDFNNKTIKIAVNGNAYIVKIADEHDQLVKKLGLSLTSSQKINSVKAPMPGLVLNVAVKKGQAINKGDTLLILEAMKMENVIKSAGEGVVKAIQIKKGQAVDKGQLMIEME